MATVGEDAQPCTMDRDEILRVLRAFEEQGLEYVLIGAAAMGFHGIVRATDDLDLYRLKEDRSAGLPARCEEVQVPGRGSRGTSESGQGKRKPAVVSPARESL